MNTTLFRQFFERIPQRTRIAIVAVLAFALGGLFAGSGGNGRYIPLGTSGFAVLDTKTGVAWKINPEHPGAYTRLASFSYF
jgi:hypothetical protein